MNPRKYLSSSPGYKVLPERLPTPLSVPELERFASRFGSLSRRDGGVAAWPVKPRKAEGTFSERAGEARFHTDAQYHATSEPFFLLARDRPARDGGENLLLTRDDVVEMAIDALGMEGVRRLGAPVWSWVIPKVFQVPGCHGASPPAPVLAPNGTIRWRIDNLVTQAADDRALAHAFADALDAFPRRTVLKLEPGKILLCDEARVGQIEALQEAMLALAEGVTKHFEALHPRLPYDDAVKRFFAKLAGKPLRAGAFRPDFLVAEDGHLWLFEITCRFPLNGMFLSAGSNQLPKIRCYVQEKQLKTVDYSRKLVQTLLAWVGQADAPWVIQGQDSVRNESSDLQPYFEGAMPLPFVYLSLEEFVARDPTSFAGTKALVAEINFEEWQRIPDAHLDAMLEGPILNDPRFVFITHDKSFFPLPFMEDITSTLLSDPYAALLRKHFAKTVLPGQAPEAWDDALAHPGNWIIKPRRLGKSEGIVAGGLAKREEWERLVANARDSDVVLQEWHEARRIHGFIGPRAFHDVYCGAWLCWGHESLGPGLIRASTHKVINVKDNRKAACLVAPRRNDPRDASLQWF